MRRAAPRPHQRAVARAVLQADRLEAIVQHADGRGVRARSGSQRRTADAPPALWRSGGARAVQCRVRRQVVACTAAHLEAVAAHGTLDEQPGRLNGERLEEEDVSQRRPAPRRSARHLEVAHAGEDGATLDDVVRHEGVQRARGGRRAEDGSAVRRVDVVLHERVRRLAPFEGVSLECKHHSTLRMPTNATHLSEHRMRDCTSEAKRADTS